MMFPRRWRVPLGGCDCYLLALEDHMRRAGQGRHVGVTFLELGEGFSLPSLVEAAARFAAAHPLLGAHLQRRLPGSIPHWLADSAPKIEVVSHPAEADAHALAESLLTGNWDGFLRFDCLSAERGTTILMSWSHLLFDARGVECVLSEVARLAASGHERPPLRQSWGVHSPRPSGLLRQLSEVRPFIDRHYELKRSDVRSLAPPPATPSAPRCRFLRFSPEETDVVNALARRATGGIFLTPYFLAMAMRAHAEVLKSRGVREGALQCAIATQGRRRDTGEPIFQNQVSQLFFTLDLHETHSLDAATTALQDQFATMMKQKTDVAFLIMVNWMRRLPLPAYRRFLRHAASGNITSFFHAHTGAFLPHHTTFCGAPLRNGWHAPSVSQPPGTGIFLSESNGTLTMTLSWRERALAPAEVDLLFTRMRADLLGVANPELA